MKYLVRNLILVVFVISTMQTIGLAQNSGPAFAFEGIRPSLEGYHVLDGSKKMAFYRIAQYESEIPELQKTIHLKLVDEPIPKVLEEIAKLGNLGVAYSSELPTLNQHISLTIEDVTISEALKLALQKTEYEAAISRRREILLVRRMEALPATGEVQQERGGVRGRITDAISGDELIGANVIVQGMEIGSATDMNGRYAIRNVPAGDQVLIVRYLGYLTQEIDVAVIPNETVELNIQLRPDVVEGDELLILSQAMGQARAIQQQRASNTIVNVVSESRIREMADANAAESVGRLPGVSIVRDGGEARNVAIRGLSSRYNNITIDGVSLPSTDFGGRSVDLNFISQEMLSGIELYKSNRPDMDADAIGGTVNFNLARIPERTVTRVNLKGGYSGQVDEFSNFGASVSGSSRFFENRLGVAGSFDIQRNDRSSDELRTSYSVLRPARFGEPHAPLEINDMNAHIRSETRDRVGGSLMFDYALPNGTLFLSGFGSRLNRDVNELERGMLLMSNEQRWYHTTREIEVGVFSVRAGGEHRLPGLADMQVNWQVSHSESSRDHPFDHRAQFVERSAFSGLDRRGELSNVVPAANNDFRNTELWRTDLVEMNAQETDVIGQLDITIPYEVTSRILGDIKFGGKILDKTRERTNEKISLFMPNQSDSDMIADEGREMITTSQGHISLMNYIDEGFQRDNLFFGNFGAPHGLLPGDINAIQVTHRSRFERDLAAPTDNQFGDERISAGYVMTELNLGSRLMFMPGVRYEHTDARYDAVFGVVSGTMNHIGWLADTTVTRNYDQWYPMYQLRYEMTDWFHIRAAYTKSSSRPTFSEVVPRSVIDPQRNFVRRSNPDLVPSTATNYDMSFTFYGNRIGLFTIGAFYKDIENLIYTRTLRILQDYEELGLSRAERNYELTQPFNNPLETSVRGVELEWQSNFTFLPYPFNGVVINANFTAMNTETQYPRSQAVFTVDGIVRVDTFRVGRMPEQPDYIANVSVGYDYRGFSARVTMLHQGPQLFAVGLRPEFDRNTTEITRFDAVIRQRLLGDMLSVYLNIHNITNEPDGAILFSDQFPTRREYYGRSFDLGLRMTF